MKGFAGLLGEERGLKFIMVQGIANEVAERERRKRQGFRLLKGKGEEIVIFEGGFRRGVIK